MKARDLVLAVVAAGSVALPAASGAMAQGTRDGMGPGMMGWGGGWGMIFGPFFMILWLAMVVALIVLLVRWLGGPWHAVQSPYSTPPARTPIDILKERFARGEIDKDEYEERRRVLGE